MPLLPPKVLEPRRRQLGVAHRVLDIFVSEVGLERSRIVAPVRQGVAAGVAQHVRVNLKAELCLDACAFDHAGKPGGAKRRTAFRCEHVCRLVLVALQPPQRAQFVAEDRMGAGRTLLDPADVQGRGFKVHLIPPQIDQFGHPQTMPVGHQHHGRVPVAVAVALRHRDQPLNLMLGEVLARAAPDRRSASKA
jgi:hypothetical protein